MNRQRAILGVMVLATCVLPVAITARRHIQASQGAKASQVALMSATTDAREIMALRERQQVIEISQRPTEDVIAQVNAVMAEIGVASGRHFKGLAPESDSAVSGPDHNGSPSNMPRVRQQSLRLSLQDLSLSEIGRFLLTWRETQPSWVPTRIELVHTRGKPDATTGRDEGKNYDLTVLLTALYLSESS